MTDYGKIYRGGQTDGPFSTWAFGATSAFDTSSGFDAQLSSGSGAVFKFAALQLTGNPTVNITGGEVNLGLVAVDSITSGGPGGVLTFSGIEGLLLATQNGSINLGSEISFAELQDLTIYARGAGSDLTLASDIDTANRVSLFAERDLSLGSAITTDNLYIFVGRNVSLNDSASIQAPTITLTAGQNFNASQFFSDETATRSSGDVVLSAAQMINIAGDMTILRQNGGISSGLNIVLSAGSDFAVGGDLSLATDISNLSSGANIDILTTGNMTVGGSLTLQTSAAAQSGSGANIDLRVGGTLSAADLFLGIELAVQSPQESGENLTLFAGQDLVAHNQTNSGGIDLEIITPIQQVVSAGANLTLSVGRNVVTDAGGDTTLLINNNINEVVNGANIFATIGGDLTTNNLSVELRNNGGQIGTGGNVLFTAGGSITAQGDAIFDIQNTSGTIGSNAVLAIAATDLNASSLLAEIDNSSGGVINGSATVGINLTGNANIAGDATIAIFGSDGTTDSAIVFNGGNYNVGGQMLAYMDGNGSISTFGNATMHADVLKMGVFGPNGAINIGGGILSADTTLKLYAPGSNGQLNFVSNVTLGGNSLKILAANSITIFDKVVVTIGGELPADVYTNNANYTGFGGNGSTTGTFAGAGANRPLPLDQAPPFGKSANQHINHGKTANRAIRIKNSSELLALLDDTVPGEGGRSRTHGTRGLRHGRSADRLNAARLARPDRSLADIRRIRDGDATNIRLGANTKPF